MAKKNKETENNGIENLDKSLNSFSSKVEKHKKLIIGIAVGVIVVVGAGIGWYYYHKYQNKESAKTTTTGITKGDQAAAKIDPLAPIKAWLVVPTEASEAYIEASLANRKFDSEFRDSLINAEYKKVLQPIAKSEEGKTGGTIANIELARIYLNEGNPKEALNAIEQTDIDEPIMKMNALVFKGDCYVDLKKYPDAIKAYDEAFDKAKEDNPEIAVRTLLKKANVLTEQKKYADALGVYEQILKDYPQIAANLSRAIPTRNGQSIPGMDVEALAERARALAGK